jgi:hypothetical protein
LTEMKMKIPALCRRFKANKICWLKLNLRRNRKSRRRRKRRRKRKRQQKRRKI